MKICGIIAEYNPFHAGHAYHAARARAVSGCDYVVAAMSGSFSQRGDLMILDPWTRTRMALECGVDLVVQLPALFAVRNAEGFAGGGVALLHDLGADVLSFGCETDDLDWLLRLAALREEEPEALSRRIAENLRCGKSHPRARGEALAEYLGGDSELLGAPNAALAVEYLRANARMPAPMAVSAIKRTSGYHDASISADASATAVRAALWRGDLDAARAAMPEKAAEILTAAWPRRAADPSALDALLLYKLRGMDAGEIAALPDVGEGLENRVVKYCREATGRESLLAMVKCKRYPYARINRLLTCALLDMTARLTREIVRPPYARVLGFRKDAQPLLRHLKGIARIPLVSDPVKLMGERCFELEMRATDLCALSSVDASMRRAGRDLTEPMVVV